MTELKEKVQNALDECRMLILGGQVLISFGAEAVLEPGFRELSVAGQRLCICGTVSLVLAVGLFMTPAAYHRIVAHGQDGPDVVWLTSRIAAVGLLAFAAGLASAVYVAGARAMGPRCGTMLGAAAAALALSVWYVFPLAARTHHPGTPMLTEQSSTPLSERIRHVLTEARMVLPGAQALLGFGSIAVLMDRFKELPEHLKLVHLTGLGAIAIAVVLLMTPAAYHRIAESGEMTERFHRIATALLLGAMVFLAFGMASATWLVVEVGSGYPFAGKAVAAGVLTAFLGTWFGWPLACRAMRRRSFT